MLYPMAGYVSDDSNGRHFKHIVYVGQNGHLQDLACQVGGKWYYNVDITTQANQTVQALNKAANTTFAPPVPNAVGYVGVALFRLYPPFLPQFFWWGQDRAIHVTIPVDYGFFWPGTPGTPGDPGDFIEGGDFDDSVDYPLGFEIDLGEPNGLASPAGWADQRANQNPDHPAS